MGWCYIEDEDETGKNFIKPIINDALSKDDPEELISLLKSNVESAGTPFIGSPHLKVGKVTQSDVLSRAISYGAINCATAFLEGKTAIMPDIKFNLECGTHPLNVAALVRSYDFVHLFLRHGADPDFRSGSYQRVFPIEAALRGLIYELNRIDPASKESSNNLFTALCRAQMNKPLQIVRLLAWRTKNCCKVFNNYAKEGKLVEMTILLIVAKDRVMSQSTLQSIDGSIRIQADIIKEMKSLSAAQRKLSSFYGQRSELVQKCEAKRGALMSALMILDLFEVAGDAIGLYFKSQSVKEPKEKSFKHIAAMVGKAGCELKDIELRTIDCKSSEIKDAARSLETEKRTADKSPPLLGLPVNPPLITFRDAKPKSWSRPADMQFEQMKISYPSWSTALQPDFPANRGLRHYSGFNKLMKAQSKGETIATARPVRLPSKPSHSLGSLALAFKRGMRHL